MKSLYVGLLKVLVILTLTGLSFAQYKVCLDPGHGGSDPGATGNYYTEANANLYVALWARDFMLRNPSISQVLMTRTSDVYVSLQDRVNYANSNYVDRFMSIHQNAYNGTVQGTETYCYTYGSSASFSMRDSTHRYLVRAYGYTDRGPKTANYYVLVYTNMPAILGEGSFIDYNGTYNESWRFAYDWYAHRGRQGLAYAQGLSAHLNLPKPTFVLHTSYPETTITAGVTFQVRDSFYISTHDAPCDLVFEVKNYSTGSVTYTQRVSGLGSGYNTRTFNVSLPSSSSNYQVYFLSYIVPQGGNWDSRITYVSTNLLPTSVSSSSQDTSYIVYKNYPLEVYANTNFTVQDSFYIAPTQSPADLVFEIKSRASGTVLYSERVSNISSGYWIKTFGLQPPISLPDSGYDYQVYFLSVLTPPGGGWSNRYTYASTYSNPTWVRTRQTQDTARVQFVSYPHEVFAESTFIVQISSHVPAPQIPADLIFEVKHVPSGNVLYQRRITGIPVDTTLSLSISLNDSLKDYSVYFVAYLTPQNGDWNSRYTYTSTSQDPSIVRTKISSIWYVYFPSEIVAESTFSVVDSFFISVLHAPCDLIFEVKSRTTGTILYSQRIQGISSGGGEHTFSTSLADSGYDYLVHFLSTLTPPNESWSNRYAYASTYNNPSWVRTNTAPPSDSSYIVYKGYPVEVYAESTFTVQESLYISSQNSPADLIFEIKHRSSGAVFYRERISSLSNGYYIKTFGLQPPISLPDSGYDYQVYFLSVLTPPGGGWSNRYTYASTYSNPTWVRTNAAPQNLFIAFTSFPEELYPGMRVYVSDTFFVQGVSLPLDHILEIRDYSTDTVIHRLRSQISSEGGGTYTFGTSESITLPDLGYAYYIYFLVYIVEPNGDFSSALVHCSSRALPTVVNTPIGERDDGVVVRGSRGVFLRLEIKGSKTQGFYFKVFDAAGRILLSTSDELMVNSREIMLSRELFPSSGVYFYEVKIGDNKKIGKFIVY